MKLFIGRRLRHVVVDDCKFCFANGTIRFRYSHELEGREALLPGMAHLREVCPGREVLS